MVVAVGCGTVNRMRERALRRQNRIPHLGIEAWLGWDCWHYWSVYLSLKMLMCSYDVGEGGRERKV